MLRNLSASHGLVFSHRLLLALVEAGVARDEAYRLVQRNAMQAWDAQADFRSLVDADPDITNRLSPTSLDSVFDLAASVQHVDTVLDRLHALDRKEDPVNV